MKKNSFIAYLIGILFLTTAVQPLWAQQRDATKRTGLFSVYSKKATESRNLTFRDMRLMRMKGMRTKFSLPDYTSLAQWKKHKKYIHDQILISAGLWPRPRPTPLHAHIFGKIIHKKYSVEKVYIEVYPDFYLAGNLYTPRGRQGPFPGILNPHGHWKQGRLQNGQRLPPFKGFASVPARCIHFARAGYVAFSYDMVGYGDTRQIAHNFAAEQSGHNPASGAKLAQLWTINLLGLQLWDSMRALAFLRSLPSVDSSRIGITGASGGGTQTYLLDAVAPNGAIDVAAPVNMISSVFQGGDLDENAPGLRLHTFNVEIAAMFAPRPQFMVSDTHDWTKNTPWAEYPMMRTIYKLYHAANHVKYAYFDYPHNYNKASREAVYKWFHRWMPGDADNTDATPTQEQPLTVDPASNLLVFLKQPVLSRDLAFNEMAPSFYHDLPKGALQMDAAAMLRYLKRQARMQLNRYWPVDKSTWTRFKSVYGVAYRHILADRVPHTVQTKVMGGGATKTFKWTKLVIARGRRFDWIPAVLFQPVKKAQQSTNVTLILSPAGKSGLANASGAGPDHLVRKLLDHGQSVLAIDVFNTGEHVLPSGVTTARDESEAHFTTFNKTDTQQRVQDILTGGKFLQKTFPDKTINLLGLQQAGIWAILAAPLTTMFKRIICNENQLNPHRANQLMHAFVPGLQRYGSVETAIALAAKHNTTVTLYNVNPKLNRQKVNAVYRIAGHPNAISFISKMLTKEAIARLLTG